MNDQPSNSQPNEPNPGNTSDQFTQRIQHQQVSALIPESVSRGTFASGALVLNGAHEFVIDFLQALSRPQQVAARIILPVSIMASVIRALKQNVDNYSVRFGPPPELPKPPQPAKPPTVEEIYDQLKIAEDVQSGVYANTVMITHSASEFCFDFITGFYPKSAVAARVYMAAPQVPRLLETLSRSFEQFQQKVAQQQQQMLGQTFGQQPAPPPVRTDTARGGEPPKPPADTDDEKA